MSEIIIFGRPGCPYTEAALKKASDQNINHVFIEVSKCPDDKMCKLFRMMAEDKNHRTVPCIFEVKYIGGFEQFNNK